MGSETPRTSTHNDPSPSPLISGEVPRTRMDSAHTEHAHPGHTHTEHAHADHAHADHAHADHAHAGHTHTEHAHAGHTHAGEDFESLLTGAGLDDGSDDAFRDLEAALAESAARSAGLSPAELKEAEAGNMTQVLEQQVPLSRAMLWRLLEAYYDGNGVAAWETVPFYPTSNAFIGDTYAALVIAFLLDVKSRLSADEPLYIVELATGMGSFSFFLMQALLRRFRDLPSLQQLRIQYVMTDFTESNLKSWEQRPEFKSLRDAGFLDFALLKPEDEDRFQLRGSGTWIDSESMRNPMIVIANYFFDSLRQDIFRFENGSLREGLVTLYRYLKTSATESPITFDQLKVREDYRPCANPYYPDSVLEAILRSYEGEADVMSILYPLGALRCLQNLKRMSRGRMMLISSDKGFTQSSYQHGYKKHPFTVHGSISYMVNYDAIRRFFELQGGSAFCTSDNHLVLVSGLFVMMDEANPWEMVRYTFQDQLVHHNRIHDLFCMHSLLREISDTDEIIRSCLGFLRQSSWEPVVFESCAPQLYEHIQELDSRQRDQLLTALPNVRANVFPVRGNRYKALYWVGKLYYGLAEYDRAIDVLKEALARVGDSDPNTLYYLGACYEMLHDERAALEYYLRARAFDPECGATQAAVSRVLRRLDAQDAEAEA